jgi:phage baseplate assembly protein W
VDEHLERMMSTDFITGHGESAAMLVPFQITGQGGVAKAVGEPAVLKQQMIGLLMTNHGERTMLPQFGADVQTKIFDPIEELESASAAQEIADTLGMISPLLNISSVTFRQDPRDAAALFLEVRYSINNNSALLTVRFLSGIVTDEDVLG